MTEPERPVAGMSEPEICRCPGCDQDFTFPRPGKGDRWWAALEDVEGNGCVRPVPCCSGECAMKAMKGGI